MKVELSRYHKIQKLGTLLSSFGSSDNEHTVELWSMNCTPYAVYIKETETNRFVNHIINLARYTST